MKNTITIALFAMFLLLTGCGPSLGEYVAQSQNYSSATSTRSKVSVQIESRRVAPEGRGVLGGIGAAVNMASSVSAMAVSRDQQDRLQRVVSSNEINAQVASGFNDGFADTTHLVVVDKSANPDLRIMLNVSDYGLWAESILAPMNFYIECEIQIVHVPTMKRIYSNSVFIRREAADLFTQIAGGLDSNLSNSWALRMAGFKTAHAVASTASLVHGAANLTAFFKMSDEEIKAIFDYMAYDAGLSVARELTNDIYD